MGPTLAERGTRLERISTAMSLRRVVALKLGWMTVVLTA
jgi:hypothetical protein